MRFALIASCLCPAIHAARADNVAAWPVGCVATRPSNDQLNFEFDLTDLAHTQGVDLSRLTSQLAALHVPSWWAEGPSPRPTGETPAAGIAERAIVVVTIFPVSPNPATERLIPRGGGFGLGIVQPSLSRMLTNDGGVVEMRSSGPIDEAVARARREATCILQWVTEIGTVDCGIERFSGNSQHIRELWVVGLEPIVDILDDSGSGPMLVTSQDYLVHAISHCLDILSGPHP
jgi:hypothetical protein